MGNSAETDTSGWEEGLLELAGLFLELSYKSEKALKQRILKETLGTVNSASPHSATTYWVSSGKTWSLSEPCFLFLSSADNMAPALQGHGVSEFPAPMGCARLQGHFHLCVATPPGLCIDLEALDSLIGRCLCL